MAGKRAPAQPQQSNTTLWRPGQSGNPKGRKPGSRNKLGDAFIEALHDDFRAHGVEVIETVRLEKPEQYLKVIVSILPKQIEIKEGAFDDISDEDLAALVAAARSALGVAEEGGGRKKAKGEPQSLN